MKASQTRILLTRSNNDTLAAKLKENGAKVLEIPLVEIEYGADAEIADDIFSNIACYSWLVFSSANGVKGFFKEFFKKFKDLRCIGPCRIACIGKATMRELEDLHLECDVVPEVATSEAMAEAMLNFETLENLTILCVGGNLSDNACAKILEEKGGAIVDTFPVYKTSLRTLDKSDQAVKDFCEYGADIVYFASPSAVESFVKNAKVLTLKDSAIRPKAYSIGKKTSAAMKTHGIKVAKQAESPDKVFEMF